MILRSGRFIISTIRLRTSTATKAVLSGRQAADSPDTTQAGLCYSRLEALFADQNRVEDENTDIIADHFTRMPDMVKTGYSRNTCSDDMTLIWLGVFRNGDTQFSYDSAGIYADDICLTVHADGSKEIEYISDYEKHVDKL